jgi:type VII secretion protein EccE
VASPTPAPPAGVGPFGWVVPVRLWQLVTWQVAALAAILALGRPAVVKEAVIALAVVVVVVTAVRVRGCTLLQWAGTLARYRRRRTVQSRAADPLTALLPGLRLRQHTDRAGNRVGVAIYSDGVSAVVRLAPATRPDPGTLLAVLRETFTSTTIPLAGAQLVVWTVAPPEQASAHRAVAAPEPARVHWLALRFRPGQAPDAAEARGGGEAGAIRAIASAALSLTVQLEDAGYSGTVLDQVALGQELMVALGAKANVAPESAGAAGETWGAWWAAGTRQACYLPDRSLDPAQLFGRWVPGAAFSCVSYTLGRTAWGRVRGEAVVRLGASTAAGARRPAPGSAFGRGTVPASGQQLRYALRTMPLAISQ